MQYQQNAGSVTIAKIHYTYLLVDILVLLVYNDLKCRGCRHLLYTQQVITVRPPSLKCHENRTADINIFIRHSGRQPLYKGRTN